MTSVTQGNPIWIDDANEPGYEKCAQAIWDVAAGLAGKFLAMRGNRYGIPNYDKKDLTSEAVLWVFIKVREGKLRGKPEAERWPYIKKIMWNRMLDLERRKHEVQAGLLDTDKALEAIDAEDALTWARQNAIRRDEIRALEAFIDDALSALPPPTGLLISLRFGLWRSDDFGAEFPTVGEPLSLQVLADAGYGESQDDVHRRIKIALERLRGVLVDRLSRSGIRNFEGYRIDATPAHALPQAA